MKRISALWFLLSLIFAFEANSQTNYALYSLPNTSPLCVDKNNNLYGIEWENNTAFLKCYNLENGNVKQKYKTAMPENPVKLMLKHPEKELLYLITAKKIDNSKNEYIDAVYCLNTKKDKIELLRKVQYKYKLPNKIGYINNNLVLTTLLEPAYLFDLKTNNFWLLCANTDYQLLSIAPSHNGFIMKNIKQLNQGKVQVCFMDFQNHFSEPFGYITKQQTIQTEDNNFQIPTITITDSTYNWVSNDYRFGGFPIMNFQLIMYPFWLTQSNILDQAYALSGILDANQNYLVAQTGRGAFVYNYTQPKNTVPVTFTNDESIKLKEFLAARNTYKTIPIVSSELENVFAGTFHQVYYANKKAYVAVEQYGEYIVLDSIETVPAFIKPEFKLSDENSAQLFEDALNVIYQPDDFNKKIISNYKVDKGWVFIRGEAFERKYGWVVSLSDANKITSISYSNNFK